MPTERNPGPPGGYHFIGWSLRAMPDWFNRLGMRVGTSLCLWTLRRQRAASREYLRLALGREPRWGELWEHFFAFTKYLLLRLSICHGADPEVGFAPGQGDELRAWIAGGRPALYGTMHVGRSDLMGFFLGHLGERVHMIRKQVGNSEDTRRLARRFERSVTFIWINDWSRLVLAMNDALREGRSLAMQCDRPEYSSKREGFRFFGGRRTFPFTIYHLAIMHGMPVALSYAVPDAAKPERTVVHVPPLFHPRAELDRRENFAAARAHFQAFLDEIETLLRSDPYLWFNFEPMNPPDPPQESRGGSPRERGSPTRNRAADPGQTEPDQNAGRRPALPGQKPRSQTKNAVTPEPRRGALGVAWAVARMFVVGFPLFGLLGLVVYPTLLLTALPLPGPLRKRYSRQVIYHAIAFWAGVMEVIGILQIDFQGVEALRGLRGAVIAPNHPSVLDATLFLARLPQVTCLMKRSILSNPFMGGTARLAGYLKNDYGPEFIRRGREALRAGENLLIFPEGTRTIQPPVNEFKKGFALITTLARAPVQTVLIEMPVFFLGKRWPLWRIPRLPVRYTVRPGRLFQPNPGQTAQALADELEAYFRENLEAAGEGVRRNPETNHRGTENTEEEKERH